MFLTNNQGERNGEERKEGERGREREKKEGDSSHRASSFPTKEGIKVTPVV